MLTALRVPKGGNPGETRTGPPTLRQTAQGRGEQGQTTIKTFGGDEFGSRHTGLSIPRGCCGWFVFPVGDLPVVALG